MNPLDVDAIDQNPLWANFDAEADSIVIYFTGTAVRAVSVHVGDDAYVKVNPANGDIVGFHIEAWEGKFTPAHPEMRAVWDEMKLELGSVPDWRALLRTLTVWYMSILESHQTAVPASHLV